MNRSTIMSALLTIQLSSVPAGAETDYLNLPGPIIFQDQTFSLAWSSRPSDGYAKHEYVPQGQKLETFSDMFLVEAVTGAITPGQAAKQQIEALEARKSGDPLLNYELLENRATGEIILDFLVSDMKGDTRVEWNAYRYVTLDGGGVGLFAISRRAYGEDGAKPFLAGLMSTRAASIEALARYDIPDIQLKE